MSKLALGPISFNRKNELFCSADKKLSSYTGTMKNKNIKVIVQAKDSDKNLEILSRSLGQHDLFSNYLGTDDKNTKGEVYIVLEHGRNLFDFMRETKLQPVVARHLLKDVIIAVQFISKQELSLSELKEAHFFVKKVLDDYSGVFCSLETLKGQPDQQSTLDALIDLLQRVNYVFSDAESIKFLQVLITEAKNGTRTLQELCDSVLFWPSDKRIVFYKNNSEWIYSDEGMKTQITTQNGTLVGMKKIINEHHKYALDRVYVSNWDENMEAKIKKVFKEAVVDLAYHGTPKMDTKFAKKTDSVCELIRGVRNISSHMFKYSKRDRVFESLENLDNYLNSTFPNLFTYVYDSMCRGGKKFC